MIDSNTSRQLKALDVMEMGIVWIAPSRCLDKTREYSCAIYKSGAVLADPQRGKMAVEQASDTWLRGLMYM